MAADLNIRGVTFFKVISCYKFYFFLQDMQQLHMTALYSNYLPASQKSASQLRFLQLLTKLSRVVPDQRPLNGRCCCCCLTKLQIDSPFSCVKVILIHPYWHKHTHPSNGPFSGTTRVSWYQDNKTNLDFTEARDSEWQWHQLGHMQVCTSLQTNNDASTPSLTQTNL